jgi:hypothetical protein
MKLSKTHWIGNVLLVALGVSLFLPVYIINRQYEQAAASKVLIGLRSAAGNYPEKYDSALPDKTGDTSAREIPNRRDDQAIGVFENKATNVSNPEIYHRRKVVVGNWTLLLFSLPLFAGLTTRRWVASALIFILLMLTWYLRSLRY